MDAAVASGLSPLRPFLAFLLLSFLSFLSFTSNSKSDLVEANHPLQLAQGRADPAPAMSVETDALSSVGVSGRGAFLLGRLEARQTHVLGVESNVCRGR